MSLSPLQQGKSTEDEYLGAFARLSQRIREGNSFSGSERNRAFRNRGGGGQFDDLSYVMGLDSLEDGRGIAVLDIDGDGDQDLCTTSRTAPRLRILRNDLAVEGHSLRIRLVGNPELKCPRDAIGARVEVTIGERKLYRTLFAGDGFVSQSSKSLHFGLGKERRVDKVVVRWPGGKAEEFAGITGSGEFLLEQGKGTGLLQPARDGVAEFAAGEAPLPAATDAGRIRLSQPLLIPEGLQFKNMDGEQVSLKELTSEGPLLVNLWASWCEACIKELGDFEKNASELKSSRGVRVVALCVDGLNEGEEPDVPILSDLLKEVGYTGPVGFANDELVAAFDRLIQEAIYNHRSMPVPVSFLIDKGGWLSAVYKGPVAIKQLMKDRSNLGKGPDVAKAESLPFEGIWATENFVTHPVAVAAAFNEGGYREDGIAHLKEFLGDNPVPPGSNVGAKQAQQLADVHSTLGELLSESGDQPGALTHFKAAVHFSPESSRLQVRRIYGMAQNGKVDEAIAQAAALREASPNNADVLALSGDIAMMAADRPSAVAFFQAVLKVNPKYIPAINNLAWIRATAPEDELRNGAEAARLGNLLLSSPRGGENPNFLSTAAAAFAEDGEFELAVITAKSALRIAERGRDLRVMSELNAAIAAYSQNKAIRDRGGQ